MALAVESRPDSQRIVITGIGAMGPNGLTLPEVWEMFKPVIQELAELAKRRVCG